MLPLSACASGIEGLISGAGAEWDAGVPLLSKAGAYTRTCAYRDREFEVLLLNWAAGAASPIHDHGGQRCWMLVLSGKLQVDDYVRLDEGDVRGYAHIEPVGSQILDAGSLDARSGRFDLHRVAALTNTSAVSLHVYSAPLRRYLVYDEAARQCETAFGTCDDVLSNVAAVSR
jgi:cysteine dioxygenase